MRSLAVIAALFLTVLVSGCGLLPDKKDETSGWSANKLYAEAKDALNEGSYDKSIKYFEKLESRYPYGRFAQQAQMEVAYAYWKSSEPASAIAACDRFIKLHPNHPNVDYVYYLKGLVNFNEDLGLLGSISGQDLTERDPKGLTDAFDSFRELATRFPDSKYTPDAVARMKYLVNAMASHEVHVARYYMKRGAYLAAINRAQGALKNYPNAPAIEEALFIMVKGYDQLGLTDLRNDAERVMRKNFPNSEFYTRGIERSEPWWKLW
ncbi:outer membrane protein assembly factor BamD [Rhodocyclus tenuis]|uniref:Outer membrane protein assembly factor BamD n=2 Tax=Rhodocyclus TaxID=1064 RepID=A0A6L5JTG4_RHOTE|nr:outer membrane protein assembly factor BamD [Rhodocyclus gracilis]MQY50321.1 outer membrane protein assembly factor BamD [Rhodocyclus gracilis]MRD71783.1 outer membrane protein assembly factor BamD [Rhodocyclus gracilis]NJA87824.1 outer membrane protein assembly factor BamD [Rhodocyclus gracilis]